MKLLNSSLSGKTENYLVEIEYEGNTVDTSVTISTDEYLGIVTLENIEVLTGMVNKHYVEDFIREELDFEEITNKRSV